MNNKIIETEEKLFYIPEALIDYMIEMDEYDEIAYLFTDIYSYVINGEDPTLSEGLGLVAFNHFRKLFDQEKVK